MSRFTDEIDADIRDVRAARMDYSALTRFLAHVRDLAREENASEGWDERGPFHGGTARVIEIEELLTEALR